MKRAGREHGVAAWTAAAALGLLVTGCGGGGRYGYARTYAYYGDEARYARQANTEAVYDDVRRLPHEYTTQTLSWFGVVTDVHRGTGGHAEITLELRTLQARNLCADETEASCRVTVGSAATPAPFIARMQLTPEDDTGENRLQPGSLVRVYGTLVPGGAGASSTAGASEGGTAPEVPVLDVRHYRHWPRGQYVTTDAADAMRR